MSVGPAQSTTTLASNSARPTSYSKHGFGDVEKIYYKGEHIITSLRREPA